MSIRWNAGIFLARAQELSRRLRSWHVERYEHPVQFASQPESWRWERLTFGEIVNADPGERPKSWQFFTPWNWVEPTEDCSGASEGATRVAYRNPDRDTDRSVTQWLMGDFLRHLNIAPPLPTLDYLKESFGHILDLPAWIAFEPRNEEECSRIPRSHDEHGEPRCYMITGRTIPTVFLESLVDAAEKLLAAAPPGWGTTRAELPGPATVEGIVPPQSTGDQSTSGITSPERRLVDIGPLPPDLQAALNAAAYCAQASYGLATFIRSAAPTPVTHESVTSIVLGLQNARNECRAAILAVAVELGGCRDAPVSVGQIKEADAHQAALALADLVLREVWSAVDPAQWARCLHDQSARMDPSCIPERFEAIRKRFRELDLPHFEEIIATCKLEAAKAAKQRQANLTGQSPEKCDTKTTIDNSAFRPAREFLDTRFTRYKQVTSALKANPWIRTHKPSKQRLLIHAGDWHELLSRLDAVGFQALDSATEAAEAFLEVARQRQEEIRQRKTGK